MSALKIKIALYNFLTVAFGLSAGLVLGNLTEIPLVLAISEILLFGYLSASFVKSEKERRIDLRLRRKRRAAKLSVYGKERGKSHVA